MAFRRNAVLGVASFAFVVAFLLAGCRSTAPQERSVATANTPPARATPAPLPNAVATAPAVTPQASAPAYSVREHYTKSVHLIGMRDGVRLYTVVYAPKDMSRPYPILLVRTPYGVGPYAEDAYADRLGPSDAFMRNGYIFVNQDVRGRNMSEGEFENMRPHNPARGAREIDESTDTYDTIDWVVKNIPNNNGRVGQWGISYPGFYSSAGMIDAHPALKAVSPQAPIADWFFDDFYHHGAFFLPHAFNFFATFGRPRPVPTSQPGPGFEHGTPDGYQFFYDLGALKNADARYFKGQVAFWNEIAAHPNYDEYWQSRNLLPHLKQVAPAVLVVGGWFDAEDLYGALNTYQAIERQNPGIANSLVMGPWRHGGWSRTPGDRLGNITFGARTSEFYQQSIELPFFEYHLRGALPGGDAIATQPRLDLAEAHVFETGRNVWRRFDRWPPANLAQRFLVPGPGGTLAFDPPLASTTTSTASTPTAIRPTAAAKTGFDEFISDPASPVPSSETIAIGMTAEYMTDDQRFAARRPDVLTYQTEPLATDVTIAGPILAELWVSTRAAGAAVDRLDADWVVKLIDVFPPDAKDFDGMTPGKRLGGYQMMVRSEVIRGRFRDSYEHPSPFKSGEPTFVDLPLQDVLHTFRKGHRIMVQIQCTWFPMVDRNPQKYVENIFEANEADFIRAVQRVYHDEDHPTRLRVGVLE